MRAMTSTRQRGRDGGFDTDPAKAPQLHSWMSEIEAGDEANQIDLNAFDPAYFKGRKAAQIQLKAGAAVSQTRVNAFTEIASNRVWRQCDAEFRHSAQDGRDKTVAVGARPDAVIAGPSEAVFSDGCLDSRNEFFRVRTRNIGDRHRHISEPTPVRRPIIGAHRLPPADDVATGPCR